MADESKIINGSFKGIPLIISSATIDGGRKVSIKQFPNRDTQTVEDLGAIPRKYTLQIIISDKLNQDYFSYRNTLLSALESKGPGVLIHPLYGRIENVVATTFSLPENFASFGDATISVNFEINENLGIPQSSNDTASQILTANNIVQAAINSNVAAIFSVNTQFGGNFAAAVDKIDSVIDSVEKSTSFISETSENLDQFNADVNKFKSNVESLISNPQALSDSLSDLFSDVNGLFSSSQITLDIFSKLFDFGEDDIEINTVTAGLIERNRNNEILNSSTAASVLGYGFLASTGIEFKTTREIDDLALSLDKQYALVQGGESSQVVKDDITDMRVKVLNVFDQARLNTNAIITVDILPTTVRLLAFDYYGDDDLAQAISDLNEFDNVSFIEGDVEILTA